MKLVKNNDTNFQGKKRQYMPYKLEWECPECGEENIHNFSEYLYLSYPKFGEPYEVGLYCDNDECGEDMEPIKTIEVIPDLKMEIKEV